MKPRVTEAAIDDVLVGLLRTGDSGVRACLAAVAPSSDAILFDRVTVDQQVAHRGAGGSADIVLRIWSKGMVQGLVLIENKIDAPFTPDQPTRYACCRDAYIAEQAAPLVATLLIAPSSYLAGSQLKDGFDGILAYESLLALVDGEHRAILKLAIERAKSPYEPVPVQAVMSFFDGYAAIAAESFPDLSIKTNPNSKNARPEASRTIYFNTRASGFRHYSFLTKGERPASIRISHQCWDSSAPSPSVKLMLDGWARHLDIVSPILKPSIRGTDLNIRRAGSSLALVADTERLNNMQPAAEQRAKIEEALLRLRQIRETWNSMEAALEMMAAMVK